MSTVKRETGGLTPDQQAILGKCFHPSGNFIEFRKEEIEQSVPDRFEERVRRYPNRLAVKSEHQELSYDALNRAANRIARAVLALHGSDEGPRGRGP